MSTPLASSSSATANSFRRSVLTAYLEPLLRKHAAEKPITWEDLQASKHAADAVLSSVKMSTAAARSAMTSELDTLHQSQVEAYQEFAKSALQNWFQTKVRLPNPTAETPSVEDYLQACVKHNTTSAITISTTMPHYHISDDVREEILRQVLEGRAQKKFMAWQVLQKNKRALLAKMQQKKQALEQARQKEQQAKQQEETVQDKKEEQTKDVDKEEIENEDEEATATADSEGEIDEGDTKANADEDEEMINQDADDDDDGNDDEEEEGEIEDGEEQEDGEMDEDDDAAGEDQEQATAEETKTTKTSNVTKKTVVQKKPSKVPVKKRVVHKKQGPGKSTSNSATGAATRRKKIIKGGAGTKNTTAAANKNKRKTMPAGKGRRGTNNNSNK